MTFNKVDVSQSALRTAAKRSASDPVPGLKDVVLGDYWAWAYSNGMDNTTRGVYAEFLIAQALGLTSKPRQNWDSVDLEYDGIGIEIKASGFLQDWQQTKPSNVQFSIRKAAGWDRNSGKYSADRKRHAGLYVFCLFSTTDRSHADPFNPGQWEFYIISCEQLEAHFPDLKFLRLNQVRELCPPVRYSDLREQTQKVVASISRDKKSDRTRD